jgi:putative sigma-54 modulation protein
MTHAVNLVADDLARQVKKHRDKRRGRREAHRAATQQQVI